MSFLATLGRMVLSMLAAIGRVALFASETVSHLFRPPYYPREFGHALLQIGYFSLPVVGLTTLFTGGALALQIYAGVATITAVTASPKSASGTPTTADSTTSSSSSITISISFGYTL